MNCFGVCISLVLLLRSKICGHCVHTKHKKVRSARIGLACLKAAHVLTPVVQCPTVWLSIFCAFANDDAAVERINCFAPPSVGHVLTPFLQCSLMYSKTLFVLLCLWYEPWVCNKILLLLLITILIFWCPGTHCMYCLFQNHKLIIPYH